MNLDAKTLLQISHYMLCICFLIFSCYSSIADHFIVEGESSNYYYKQINMTHQLLHGIRNKQWKDHVAWDSDALKAVRTAADRRKWYEMTCSASRWHGNKCFRLWKALVMWEEKLGCNCNCKLTGFLPSDLLQELGVDRFLCTSTRARHQPHR